MRNELDKKAREELKRLDAEARSFATTAELALGHDSKSPKAISHALLAIERRLAMATSFMLWALEADDETD